LIDKDSEARKVDFFSFEGAGGGFEKLELKLSV
jgi:hypothetical protein